MVDGHKDSSGIFHPHNQQSSLTSKQVHDAYQSELTINPTEAEQLKLQKMSRPKISFRFKSRRYCESCGNQHNDVNNLKCGRCR